jgi:hypothetical protein
LFQETTSDWNTFTQVGDALQQIVNGSFENALTAGAGSKTIGERPIDRVLALTPEPARPRVRGSSGISRRRRNMISPLQIEFHNIHAVEAVESRIRQELAEFEKFYNRLVSCRVEVDAPEHERRGGLCKVRIEFGLPPEDATGWAELLGLAGKHGADRLEIKAKRKDASMAVHAAFNVARRRLKDFVGIPSKRA